jgi:phage gp36-like protein
MAYITHVELAERPGARELSQLASAETQAGVVEPALLDATLRDADRSAWSADKIAAADAALARIDDAVAEAGGIIDGYLTQRGYVLPLNLPAASTGKNVLTAWARAISRYLLNKSRITDEAKDPVARDHRDALKMLGLLADGKYSLGAGDMLNGPATSATDVRIASAPRVFGRDQLRSFR